MHSSKGTEQTTSADEELDHWVSSDRALKLHLLIDIS